MPDSADKHLACRLYDSLRQAGRLSSGRTALTLPKRMNNKQNDGNGDAGIGDIKRGPGVRVWNVQIKKEEIDHVPVKKAISKISQDASEQERERHITPNIG